MGRKKITRLCSLDISSTKTGVACYENGKLIHSGLLDHSKEKNSIIRCEDMGIDIIDYLNKYKPEIVVIEESSVARNTKGMRMLAMLAGTVNGWVLCNYAEFVMYKPTEWRKHICEASEKAPYRREEAKKWAIDKVYSLYNKKVSDDEAEGILIGLARIKEIEKIKQKIA